LKTFELTIPKQYLDYINKEIKKPKRLNTELLELWLERELSIITAQLLPNGNFKVIISEVIFGMIKSHVQPEPHSHKIHNEDLFHCWLDIKTNRVHSEEHIKIKETT
jgi:hypothetical protein